MTAIVALSSGALPSGVAVLRVSGHPIDSLLEPIVHRPCPARQAVLANLYHPKDGEVLDSALVIAFPGPHSFTGEDVVEFHCHGGRATVSALVEMLTTCFQIRPAEAGEFTRRAYENGKLDLTAVEGLSALIEAQTEAQRVLALRHAEGHLRRCLDSWRLRLINARASLEAMLDFSDEDDVPADVTSGVIDDIYELQHAVDRLLASSHHGEIIRGGYRIALLGPPNAGKSSLLNALSRRDVAIVTETPGTTRDVLETSIDLDGYLVRLFDTAGLRKTDDLIEIEGMRRARQTAEAADLVLWLSPVDQPVDPPEDFSGLVVRTKSDLEQGAATAPVSHLSVSTRTDDGLDDLLQVISHRLLAAHSLEGSEVLANKRQRLCLVAVRDHLDKAAGLTDSVLMAEELRMASMELGRLTGTIDVEDLLDQIFSSFCIGK